MPPVKPSEDVYFSGEPHRLSILYWVKWFVEPTAPFPLRTIHSAVPNFGGWSASGLPQTAPSSSSLCYVFSPFFVSDFEVD